MSDIFKEIDDVLRKERWVNIWKRYGVYLIGALVLFLAAIGGYNLWTWQKAQKSERAAEFFFDAVYFNEQESDIEALLGLSQQKGAVRLPSSFALVKHYLSRDQSDKALQELERIIKDKKLPLLYRDLASIHKSLILQQKKPAEALMVLADLRNINRPFRPLALYLSAVLQLSLRPTDQQRTQVILWLETVRSQTLSSGAAILPDEFQQHVVRILSVLKSQRQIK